MRHATTLFVRLLQIFIVAEKALNYWVEFENLVNVVLLPTVLYSYEELNNIFEKCFSGITSMYSYTGLFYPTGFNEGFFFSSRCFLIKNVNSPGFATFEKTQVVNRATINLHCLSSTYSFPFSWRVGGNGVFRVLNVFLIRRFAFVVIVLHCMVFIHSNYFCRVQRWIHFVRSDKYWKCIRTSCESWFVYLNDN